MSCSFADKKCAPLRKLGRVVTGKTPSTDKDEYFGGGIPFITPSDIDTYDKKHIVVTERTLSALGAKTINGCKLPAKSVCFVCIGSTIGKMCMTRCPSYTNQQINSIIPNDLVHPDYLFYLLRFIRGYFQSIGGGTGSGKGIVNKTIFSKTKIWIIKDKVQQYRIASTLSAYDDLIENNNRRIKILEQMAENLYKEWFVHFRFPGHEHTEFENGIPKGWILSSSQIPLSCPMNWKYGTLDELGSFKRGKNITAEDMVCGSIPVISAGIEPSGYHNESNVQGKSLTISSSGANAGFLKYHLSDIWAADCSYCKDNGKIWFIYNALKFLQPVISNLQIGAAQPHVYPKHINKLSTIIPDDAIIAKYCKIVGPFYNQIQSLSETNQNLIKQRDMLMPRLMSGKLKV